MLRSIALLLAQGYRKNTAYVFLLCIDCRRRHRRHCLPLFCPSSMSITVMTITTKRRLSPDGITERAGTLRRWIAGAMNQDENVCRACSARLHGTRFETAGCRKHAPRGFIYGVNSFVREDGRVCASCPAYLDIVGATADLQHAVASVEMPGFRVHMKDAILVQVDDRKSVLWWQLQRPCGDEDGLGAIYATICNPENEVGVPLCDGCGRVSKTILVCLFYDKLCYNA
jgi:hypothetical protein